MHADVSPPSLASRQVIFPRVRTFTYLVWEFFLFALVWEFTDVILHYALKARLGGETRESFIITHEVYFEGSLKSHGIAVTVNRCAIGKKCVNNLHRFI